MSTVRVSKACLWTMERRSRSLTAVDYNIFRDAALEGKVGVKHLPHRSKFVLLH